MSVGVGVVAALAVEARCLAAARRGPGVRVEVSGVGRLRAAAAAARLIAEGAQALVSWGVAGGLDPELDAGTVVLPERVVAPGGEALATNPDWLARVRERLASACRVSLGDLLEAERVLLDPAEKHAAHRGTGAVAVDLESAAVGRAAAAAGLPFLVVRVVCDPASRALPRTALVAVDERGGTDVRQVALSLLRRPWDAFALLGLQRAFARARRGLRSAAAALGPDLLAPRSA